MPIPTELTYPPFKSAASRFYPALHQIRGGAGSTHGDLPLDVRPVQAARLTIRVPTIALHHGRVVKRTGDGVLIEFRSVVDAVRCAIEIQNGMVERNAGLSPERRIEFRVGIHLGDVVEESDGDLMGDGVNIAARLEGVADPGGICLSEDAYRQVRDRVKKGFSDLGDKTLRNIARPVRAYAVILDRKSMQSEPIGANTRAAR